MTQLKTVKQFACRKCIFETNSKSAFKAHIDEQHPFCENNLARKDLLLEVA